MPLKTLGTRGPCGVLGAVLAVIAVEAAFARHDLDLGRPENLNWRWGRHVARRNAPQADILCFGTSMMQTGLLPRLIAERTGRQAYGMAVVGSQMPYSYYLFKQALASGAKPSTLIIDFPVNFLGSSLDSQPAGWPDALNFRDTFDMAWQMRDSRFFAAVVSEKLLPTLAFRLQTRKAVSAALNGESASLLTENVTYLRNYNKNLGAFMAGKKPGYAGEVSDHYVKTFLNDAPWKPDPIKARYFRRLIELAAANGVRVYWVMSPFVPDLQAGRDSKKLDAAYNEFAWAMTSKFPNLMVLDARHAGYKADVFMDAVHLDIDGASTLSQAVADAIENDESGSSKWVNLPPFRPRPINVPVEIAADSFKALFSGGEVRR